VELLFPELDLSFEHRSTMQGAEEVWAFMTSSDGIERVQAAFKQLLGLKDHASMVKGRHSDGLVAMDSQGNICSLVHTANSLPWGSGIFVEGSALPNAASGSPEIVTLASEPGGRVPSVVAPILGLNNPNKNPDYFRFALSVIGLGLHSYEVQILPRLFNWGSSPKAAIDSSFFGGPDWYSDPVSPQPMANTIGLDSFAGHLLREVQAMRQPLTVSAQTPSDSTGPPVLIISSVVDNKVNMIGAASPVANGYAEGIP